MGECENQWVMKNIETRIAEADWMGISNQLHDKGFALVPGLLSREQCESIKATYGIDANFRKTVIMERYRFGLGEYKYYQYPLPEIIQVMRNNVYPKLAPVANDWMKALKIETEYPLQHDQFLKLCHLQKQIKATVLMLKYGKGGHNTLHQDLYGEVYFPMQMVFMLSDPEKDFEGGEFVLIEQIPRAQSKAAVLNPQKGDAIIFSTNFRPVKGKNGYYRVNMKHGVSEVHKGERYTLGIIFHDALA
jgi:uncharacterized protein